MLLDLALIAVSAANILNSYFLYKKKQQIKKIEEENSALSEFLVHEHLAVDGRDKAVPHKFAAPTQQTISISFWTYGEIVVQVWICQDCHLIHKMIIGGSDLAKKRNLLDVEGYYLGMSKIPYDPGCLISKKEEKNV